MPGKIMGGDAPLDIIRARGLGVGEEPPRIVASALACGHHALHAELHDGIGGIHEHRVSSLCRVAVSVYGRLCGGDAGSVRLVLATLRRAPIMLLGGWHRHAVLFKTRGVSAHALRDDAP